MCILSRLRILLKSKGLRLLVLKWNVAIIWHIGSTGRLRF